MLTIIGNPVGRYNIDTNLNLASVIVLALIAVERFWPLARQPLATARAALSTTIAVKTANSPPVPPTSKPIPSEVAAAALKAAAWNKSPR